MENTKSPIKEGIVYKDIPKKGGFLKDIMVDKHNVIIYNRYRKIFKIIFIKINNYSTK